jgi:ATP-dependent RNA helicase DDX46/PRP5
MGKDRRHRRSRSTSLERDRERDRGDRDRDRDRDGGRHRRDRDRDNRDKRANAKRSRSPRDRRDRDRDRDRDSKKKRKRSRSPKEPKASFPEPVAVAPAEVIAEAEEEAAIDKESEQQRLEMEMTKRRERIEKWRAEKRKKEMETARNEAAAAAAMGGKDTGGINPIAANAKAALEATLDIVNATKTDDDKKWSLEDDEDEVDEAGGGAGDDEESEDEDPLDAYMSTIAKEVKKIKGPKGVVKQTKSSAAPGPAAANGGDKAKKAVVIMMGVAKKKEETAKAGAKRGELIEQNQDGLEYSSEEENKDSEKIAESMEKIANKGKKEIMKVDHNKIEYIDFVKDFYREVPELSKMTDEEVEEYRTEMEGVKVKGKNVPRPIKTWPQCGVSSKILEILKRNAYVSPTPIQAQAIPVVMSGRDMMGIAKTGSGKTLAFLLPLFRHISSQPELEEGDGPIAIIMTPTRELCMQIGKEVKRFLRAMRGVRCVVSKISVHDNF